MSESEKNNGETKDEVELVEIESDNEAPTEDKEIKSEPKSPEERKKMIIRETLEWIRVITLAVAIGLALISFVAQRNTVFGPSMYPTLKEGDELIVEKITRYSNSFKRGDIITLKTNGIDANHPGMIIKRIVGLPGELVEISNGAVYVNGNFLAEQYLVPGVTTKVHNQKNARVQLGEKEYYVMGDNRDYSYDSRDIGAIPMDWIKHVWGKVLIRVYPFDHFGKP